MTTNAETSIIDRTKEIAQAAKNSGSGVREQKKQSYSRLLLGKATLAYVWMTKRGTKVDLYVEELPESVTIFSPARGRARKEGLVATITSDDDLGQFAEGLKAAIEAVKGPKATKKLDNGQKVHSPHPAAADEHSADLAAAAKAADAKPSSKRQATPDPKPPAKKRNKRSKATA